jgi:hypothetical protein
MASRPCGKSLLALQMAPTGRRRRIDSRKLHKPDAGEWHFSLRRVKKASDSTGLTAERTALSAGFDRHRPITKKQ